MCSMPILRLRIFRYYKAQLLPIPSATPNPQPAPLNLLPQTLNIVFALSPCENNVRSENYSARFNFDSYQQGGLALNFITPNLVS